MNTICNRKNLQILIFSICLIILLTFQENHLSLAKLSAGAKGAYSLSLVQTSDGGYMVAGASELFGYNEGGIVLKVDQFGIIEWEKTYLYQGIEDINTIWQVNSSQLLIAGDRSFAAINENGVLQWTETINDEVRIEEIIPLETGEYILAGSTRPSITKASDFWISQTFLNRTIDWNETYRKSIAEADILYSAIQTSKDDVVLVGFTSWFEGENFGLQVYVVMITSTGEVKWEQTYGDQNSIDSAYTAIEGEDGHILVAGTTGRQGVEAKMFLWKLNSSNGELIWTKSFPSLFEDCVYSLASVNGGYILAGYNSSVNYQNSDLKVINTDSNGNSVWMKSYDLSYDDGAYEIIPTNDGGYAVVGYITINALHDQRPWMLKLNSTGMIEWENHLNLTTAYKPALLIFTPVNIISYTLGIVVIILFFRKRTI